MPSADKGGYVADGDGFVEDESGQWDVWGISIKYTDGPMALSLGHMAHDVDDGTARTATMFSASYTLAPGVVWRNSIFPVEDNTARMDQEGTGFVTRITLNF